MALVDSEGFGFSTTYSDYVASGRFRNTPSSFVAAGGPFGDNFFNGGTSNGGPALLVLPSAYAGFSMGVRFNPTLGSSQSGIYNRFILADSAGNAQLVVTYRNNNGSLQVTRGYGGPVLATTGSNQAPTAAWSFLEMGGRIDPAAGSLVVRINGIAVITLSGINTNGAPGSTSVALVGFGSDSSSYLGGSVAHFYFCDDTGPAPWNTFLGDVRVQTLLPTSDDALQFAPRGQVANWQNVSQVPPIPGTDFNADSVVGHQDTFNCASVASALTRVFGVNVKGLFTKSDAGSRAVQTVLKSGAATVLGTPLGLTASPLQQAAMYPLDPATGAAWTQAAVDAAKPGYRIQA